MRIPTHVAKCRRCGGQLRLATMNGRKIASGKIDVIVCDTCQRFTVPPPVVAQWAADTRGMKPQLELLCP